MRTEELLYGDSCHHIIVAPHCDDELIGCSEIMVNAEMVTVLVTPHTDVNCEAFKGRMSESRNVMSTIVSAQGKGRRKVVECQHPQHIIWRHKPSDADTLVFWFPDPTYEHHPNHKIFSNALREQIIKNTAGFATIFGLYSVNMQVPYLHCLDKKASANKMVLADMYVSQRGYFEKHNDSFYFEGRILL